MISSLALVASAGVILAYFYTTKTGKVRPLHWANALGAAPIALAAALAGAWASVPLTVLFGAAGVYGLAQTRHPGPIDHEAIRSGYDEERRRNG